MMKVNVDQDFEIYSIDDHHIYVVLQGKASGLIHFSDYDEFAAFFEKFFDFIEACDGNGLAAAALPHQPLQTTA